MQRSYASSLLALAGLITFGAASGCNKTTTPGGGGHTASVTIAGSAYSPTPDTVAVGTMVTWTNNDGILHTVTSDTPGLFNSADIATGGGQWPHTFSTTGTFSYHCLHHGSMHGTIVVQ